MVAILRSPRLLIAGAVALALAGLMAWAKIERAGRQRAEASAALWEATAAANAKALETVRAEAAADQAAIARRLASERARTRDLDDAITRITAHAADACRLSPADPLQAAAEWVRQTRPGQAAGP